MTPRAEDLLLDTWDLFDVSMGIPEWAADRLHRMPAAELDVAAYIGTELWKKLVYDVMVDSAGYMGSGTLTDWRALVTDHGLHLEDVSVALGLHKLLPTDRAGKERLWIIVHVLDCSNHSSALEWLRQLLKPVIALATKRNKPRLDNLRGKGPASFAEAPTTTKVLARLASTSTTGKNPDAPRIAGSSKGHSRQLRLSTMALCIFISHVPSLLTTAEDSPARVYSSSRDNTAELPATKTKPIVYALWPIFGPAHLSSYQSSRARGRATIGHPTLRAR
ncbi:hypothetical protein B0H16DRAFT_1851970 [Mycena metata]|uniref:Uncharacterized protein n=1 Tax=Mycena metata TaxID=1033252 RepID=A0AAD7INT3_9AGAR|nr:hypothetical protein B0H16DRAFT_1851970 [Mycena metata]